jgi:hypothetical protein
MVKRNHSNPNSEPQFPISVPAPMKLSEQDMFSMFCLYIDRNGGKLQIDNVEELKNVIFTVSVERGKAPDSIVIKTTKYIKAEKNNDPN